MPEEKIKFPMKPTAIKRTMPQSLLIQAFGKTGKSTVAAGLTTQFAKGKSCVVSLGKETSYDNLEVTEYNIESANKFEIVLDELIAQKPYDYVIFDHTSTFDYWVEILGTVNYMNSPMGKKHNLKNENGHAPGFKAKPAAYWKPGDKQFESVHKIAQGYGYRWSKDEGIRLFKKMLQVAPYVIFIGHMKLDRYSKDDKGNTVNSKYLDVTGNLGRYMCKEIDALATLKRVKDEGFLVFKTGSSDLDAGTRYSYLDNQEFKISEKQEDGSIKTFWENIYPDYEG